MGGRFRTNWFFGLLAGLILSIFGKSASRLGGADLRGADFKTSTQGMGFRFTDRVRDVFRFRWIKKR